MSKPDFQTAFCSYYNIPQKDYQRKLLSRILTIRSRLVYPFCRLVTPTAFHPERRLVQSVAKANSLVDIQYEVDFYQHKRVVNSIVRGTLRFRASGKNLMSIAKRVYHQGS